MRQGGSFFPSKKETPQTSDRLVCGAFFINNEGKMKKCISLLA